MQEGDGIVSTSRAKEISSSGTLRLCFETARQRGNAITCDRRPRTLQKLGHVLGKQDGWQPYASGVSYKSRVRLWVNRLPWSGSLRLLLSLTILTDYWISSGPRIIHLGRKSLPRKELYSIKVASN
ncbi:hypothetical protein ACJJTC_011708 [Scirpophaga incertulas]